MKKSIDDINKKIDELKTRKKEMKQKRECKIGADLIKEFPEIEKKSVEEIKIFIHNLGEYYHGTNREN